MSPEDDEPQVPRVPSGDPSTGEVPSASPTDEPVPDQGVPAQGAPAQGEPPAGAGDIESPTSWAAPTDEVPSPEPAEVAATEAPPSSAVPSHDAAVPTDPSADTGYAAPEAYVEPEPDTAYVAPEPDSAYVAAEPESEYVAAEPESEYVAPEPDTEYVAAEPQSEYVAPEPATEYIEPEPDTASVAPEPDAAYVEPEADESYESYEAEPYEADAVDPYETGDVAEPAPVASPARRPPARRPPARRPPARRPAATRAPTGRRPAPSRSARPSRGETPPPASETPNRRGVVILLSVLTLAVVALAIWGFTLSRRSDDESGPTASTAPATTLATLPDEAFLTFRDLETNFTIRYPRGWVRTEAPNREIRLQVTDGRQFAVRVQVRRTEVATTPANIGNLEPVMSGLVVGDSRVLSRDPVTINGLIGFRYIYTFMNEDGLEEAHVHYFLFQGHKLNSIVFAAPSSEFGRIEGVFEQMINSFRSEPDPAATTPPTTG